jgi:hypothetical protein
MKRRLQALVALAAVLVATSCHAAQPQQQPLLSAEHAAHLKSLHAMKLNPVEAFGEWVAQHGKTYADDAAERARRFKAWAENLEFVLEYNSKHTTHWLGMNALADLTHEEYRDRKLGGFKFTPGAKGLLRGSHRSPGFKYEDVDVDSLPKSVDWREHGAVTEVKNQAQVGRMIMRGG